MWLLIHHHRHGQDYKLFSTRKAADRAWAKLEKEIGIVSEEEYVEVTAISLEE